MNLIIFVLIDVIKKKMTGVILKIYNYNDLKAAYMP